MLQKMSIPHIILIIDSLIPPASPEIICMEDDHPGKTYQRRKRGRLLKNPKFGSVGAFNGSVSCLTAMTNILVNLLAVSPVSACIPII